MQSRPRAFYYILDCPVQKYEWGNRDPSGIIRNLTRHSGNDTGKSAAIQEGNPLAELWMGAHPSAPSRILPENTPLHLAIEQDPDHFLGDRMTGLGFDSLPFLFKVLDAGRPLSIQAHPDMDLARWLHNSDPEHYPDENHKPELAICRKNLRALVGFRPVPEIRSFMEKYPELSGLCSNPGEGDDRWLRLTYGNLMRAERSTIGKATAIHTKRIQESIAIGRQSPEEALFLELASLYGTEDPGLFCVYFLNYLELREGESLFLGPNEPHAYLGGEIIECMAASDNVVRAGLTQKFCDVETLLSMLHYRAGRPPIIRGIPDPSHAGREIFPVPVEDFSVFRYLISGDRKPGAFSPDRPVILLVMEGELRLEWRREDRLEESLSAPAGTVLYLAGDLAKRSVQLHLSSNRGCEVYGATTGENLIRLHHSRADAGTIHPPVPIHKDS